MSNIIKIKRGSSANLDSVTLQEGELATTTDTRKLYIGNADGTKTELGQQGPQGVRGTKWWVGDFYSQMFDDANDGDLLLNTSETSPGEVLQFYDGMWDSVANIRGPQGPQGEKGEPGESIPVGSIIPYGNSVVPETYLLCNGQAVSRTEYSELFAIIGTSFGSGDGSTTFNVPDYRDKFVLGAGGDVDLAETGGEKEHTLTTGEMPKHHHQCSGAGNTALKNGAYTLMSDVNGQNPRPNFYTGWEGGGQPHNNMPPYVGTYYIIKAKQSAGIVATVVDNLSSTSATDALSANMGKKLNDKISAQKITLIIGDSWTGLDSNSARDGAISWTEEYSTYSSNSIINKAKGGCGFARPGYDTFKNQYLDGISNIDINLLDTIIIYGGLNDIDNVSETNIISGGVELAQAIKEHSPKAKVYCAFFNLPKRNNTKISSRITTHFIEELSPYMWNFCRAAGWLKGNNGELYASDGYHPNAAGCHRIVECMMAFLSGTQGPSIDIEWSNPRLSMPDVISYPTSVIDSNVRYYPLIGTVEGELSWTLPANVTTNPSINRYIQFAIDSNLDAGNGCFNNVPSAYGLSGANSKNRGASIQGNADTTGTSNLRILCDCTVNQNEAITWSILAFNIHYNIT